MRHKLIIILTLLTINSYSQCGGEFDSPIYHRTKFISTDGDTLNQLDSAGLYEGLHVYTDNAKNLFGEKNHFLIGHYHHGLPIGDWKEHCIDGSFYTGHYNCGVEASSDRNGKWIEKKQGIYKKIGVWKYFDNEGNFIKTEIFDSIYSREDLKKSKDKPYLLLAQIQVGDTIIIFPYSERPDKAKGRDTLIINKKTFKEIESIYGNGFKFKSWPTPAGIACVIGGHCILKYDTIEQIQYTSKGIAFRKDSKSDSINQYIIRSPAKCKISPNIVVGKSTIRDVIKIYGDADWHYYFNKDYCAAYKKYGNLSFGVYCRVNFGKRYIERKLSNRTVKIIKIDIE